MTPESMRAARGRDKSAKLYSDDVGWLDKSEAAWKDCYATNV
jgi:hypothetical protein